MPESLFWTIAATGFTVAFAHAAIPTHWLPFVLAGRGQRWPVSKTLFVVTLAGLGHVLFTTMLGVLVVWLGIETSRWTGHVFPWLAGGALVLIGLYYSFRQLRDGGHGHHHFGPGHGHHDHSHHHHSRDPRDHHRHDDAAHKDHARENPSAGGALSTVPGRIRVDTGHGVVLLDVLQVEGRVRFQVRPADERQEVPEAEAVSLEIWRQDGSQQSISFSARDGYLESIEEVVDQPWKRVELLLGHSDHVHRHGVLLDSRAHGVGMVAGTAEPLVKSDKAVILGLLGLLTFSPCEGFLPVYLSGAAYGWTGFIALSAILAIATVVGMIVFTWLTLRGIERLRLGFLERYESGILGALFLFLGAGIALAGF